MPSFDFSMLQGYWRMDELVGNIADQLGLSRRTIVRWIDDQQSAQTASFSEEELVAIQGLLDQALARHLRELRKEYKGLILITDDMRCETVRQRIKDAAEERWASMSSVPFRFPSVLLRLDNPIYVVFRDPHLTEVLAKTEPDLYERAIHQFTLPSIKSGDHVVLIDGVGREGELQYESYLKFKVK